MNTNKPELWERIKNNIMNKETAGTKAGQWSARKSQLLVREYKKQNGGYTTKKDPNSPLTKWTNQNWMTKSGMPSIITHERYLPEKAIKSLSSKEYNESSKKKKEDFNKGIQHSKQPENIKNKVSYIINRI
jgi:hypothetical protein